MRFVRTFRDATAEIDAADPSNLDDLAEVISRALADAQPLLDDFRALDPPASADQFLEQYVEGTEEQLTLLELTVDAAEDGDVQRVQTYVRDATEVGARQRGLAQGYGFQVCGTER
jgi:hypothetical protein